MKKLLEANTASGRRRISQVFADFCELTAITFRNAVDKHGYDEREARYMQIIGGYTAEEADRFAELLAKLTLTFENGLSDHLGQLYMSLDMGNDRLGQFFTPYSVSTVMAKMTVGDHKALLADRDFITVSEPTCGSGGMIVALAEALRDVDVNYQQQLHVTAQDVDITAVHMTFIQLTLLHVPAAVVHGDTLTLEQRDVWYTPAHILGGWNAKLVDRAAAEAETEKDAPVTPVSNPTKNDDDKDRRAA